MTLHWIKEDVPRWDAEKQRVFGPAELASVGLHAPEPGQVIADEWWRVTDDRGATVGYGWLDTEWGDAQITFLVVPSRRGAGIGEYILECLEAEAGDRGVNYIYNVIPDSHPDPGWMRNWLTQHGFTPGAGDLRRQVRPQAPVARQDSAIT
jgi:GNAT superfamily N-acetyltransferase